MAKAWRDVDTGEYVSEETYNRSRAHGGTRYEEIDTEQEGEPTQIFGDLRDFEDMYEDYEESDMYDYFFDGGIEYGEAE